ncbi:MAG TPA: RNase adapter RapZ [Terriglobia bacterium]|nr:RNase adapter RapZ [Terriglobia bacterium]
MKRASAQSPLSRFVLITGLSGAGKGSALRAFEDLGYYCVDNLPTNLIRTFRDLCFAPNSRITKAAVAVDIRERQAISQLPSLYAKLLKEEPQPSLLFLDASDEAIIRRFEETRRPHPLGSDLPLQDGINRERRLLRRVRQLAHQIIDTTRLNGHELRQMILGRFGGGKTSKTMPISMVSFGFRFGLPPDADLVFDVRFLPNPNYVRELKRKTGRDPEVERFMDAAPATRELIERVSDLLLYLLPHYLREGKSYLTIAVGCTGGRHRSVLVAERLASALSDEGYESKVIHRDIGRAA